MTEDNDYDLTKMKEELADYALSAIKSFIKKRSAYPVLPDDTSAQTDSNYNFEFGKKKIILVFHESSLETKINDNDYTLYTAKGDDNSEDNASSEEERTGTDESGKAGI